MLRKLVLSITFAASFAVAGLVVAERSEAVIRIARRPVVGTYYYYNGPPTAFVGPPIRLHTSVWDVGPYGPGYGWIYERPVGAYINLGN